MRWLLLICLALTLKAETRLNNLVVELLQQPGAFELKSEAWVHLSAEANLNGDDRIFLSFDNDSSDRLGLTLSSSNPKAERQNFLPAGPHKLTLQKTGAATLKSLSLRRVPETTFSKFGATPKTLSAGDHDWPFLSEYILPHINTIVGLNNETSLAYIRQWRSRGGRWLAEVPKTASPADLLNTIGMKNPHFDGILVDEFQIDTPNLQLWTNRITSDKEIRFYLADDDWTKTNFVQKQIAAGRKLVWEKYLSEGEPLKLAESMTPFRNLLSNSIICLGFSSAPYFTINRSAEIDFKVWMDLQFHQLATHPIFIDLPGIMEYQTRTTDEETFRWAALLFRHYAIEGQTNLLSHQYDFTLNLKHITNPDFREGATAWKTSGNVKFETYPRLALLQGRFRYTNTQDHAAVIKGPAQLSQTIRNLKRGRQYSAKFISIRKEDLETKTSEVAYHPIRLQIDKATVLPERGSRDLIANPPSGARPPWTAEKPLWIDYQQVVFHADSESAELKIEATEGLTLLVNFIEVQPYLPR